VTPTALRRLNENFLLFFTGITRQAGSILGEQQRNINGRRLVLRELKQMAVLARDALARGDVEILGLLLHESWLLKKQLAGGISNGTIDAMYQAARDAGATGGKLTGAGGGGFLPWAACRSCPSSSSPMAARSSLITAAHE
jgi:D-glycero-alpha-D-manno-heptose-7-phosphate kinase